jgi:ribosomal protein L40E
VNDERKGSIGSSGRLILTTIPAGRHILRVSKPGENDDERVIEIREAGDEQVIQAQLKQLRQAGGGSQPSSSGVSSGTQSSVMPGIVACTNCSARFAQGVKFCGKCGNRSFMTISEGVDKMDCPRCSAKLPAHSKFCGRCGLHIFPQTNIPVTQSSHGFSAAPRQIEQICGRCGSKYPPAIKFCGKCGNQLN